MFLFTSRPRTLGLDVMFLMGNKFPPNKLLNVLLRTYLDLGPPVPLGDKKSFFAVTIEPARAPCQLTPISSRSSLKSTSLITAQGWVQLRTLCISCN